MYRDLESSQKKSASRLFQQVSLLAVAGSGYQYINGTVKDVVVAVVLAIAFGIVSIDILKGLKDNNKKGDNDE